MELHACRSSVMSCSVTDMFACLRASSPSAVLHMAMRRHQPDLPVPNSVPCKYDSDLHRHRGACAHEQIGGTSQEPPCAATTARGGCFTDVDAMYTCQPYNHMMMHHNAIMLNQSLKLTPGPNQSRSELKEWCMLMLKSFDADVQEHPQLYMVRTLLTAQWYTPCLQKETK